jgi:hypothetical protein
MIHRLTTCFKFQRQGCGEPIDKRQFCNPVYMTRSKIREDPRLTESRSFKDQVKEKLFFGQR